MSECEIFYEIKKLNEEIDSLKTKCKQTKETAIKEIIYQAGKDEFYNNIRSLSQLVIVEKKAKRNKIFLQIGLSLLIISAMIVIILFAPPAFFLIAILLLVVLGFVGYFLITEIPTMVRDKKLKAEIASFQKDHNSYNEITISNGTIQILGKSLYNYNSLLSYEDKNIFYKSELTAIKENSYDKQEEFVLNNQKYSKKLEEKLSNIKNQLLKKMNKREKISDEIMFPVAFLENKIFINLMIEIFETNENIKTRQEALTFIVEKIKENDINKYQNELEKTNNINDIVAVANRQLDLTFIPKFW